MSDLSPFQSLLDDLESRSNAKSNQGSYTPRPPQSELNKLFMAVPDNHGTHYIVPVLDGKTNSPLVLLDGVMEMKLKVGDYDKTIRILDKSMYSNLKDPNSNESKLYDEIASSFKYLKDNDYNYTIIKRRNYTLMFAYMLTRLDDAGNIKDNNKPVLYIMADASIRDSYQSAVKTKSALSGGSIAWMPSYFSRSNSDRSCLVKLTYKRGTTYSSSFSFEKIDAELYGITNNSPVVGFDEKFLNECFNDAVAKLINSEDRAFDFGYYTKVKDSLLRLVRGYNATKLATEQSAPAPQVSSPVAPAPMYEIPPTTPMYETPAASNINASDASILPPMPGVGPM